MNGFGLKDKPAIYKKVLETFEPEIARKMRNSRRKPQTRFLIKKRVFNPKKRLRKLNSI